MVANGKLTSLRKEQRDLYTKLKELQAHSEWTPEQKTEWDSLNKRFEEVDAELDKAPRGVPIADAIRDGKTFRHGESIEAAARERLGIRASEHTSTLGDMCCLLAGRRPENDQQRALAQGADATGGAAVDEILSGQWIDVARNMTVASRAGVEFLPIGAADTLHFPKQDSDPVAAWRNEAAAIAESDPTFSRVTATPFSLAVQFKASRELLMNGIGVPGQLMRSTAQAMAVQLDKAVFVGSGSAPEPEGITNVTGVQEVSFDSTLANYSPIIEGLQLVESANEQPSPYLVTSPRTKYELAGLVDADNNPLRMPEVVSGLSQLATTSIPTDGGAGSDESTIFLGDFSQVCVVLRENIRLFVLKELHAATGEVGFIAHAQADVIVKRPAALCQITGIQP